MTGHEDRAVSARLTELEATVRGLTQELVSAEERIRQLELAIEADGGDLAATRDTPAGGEAGDESTAADAAEDGRGSLDDIIVA